MMANEKRLIDANALQFEPDENCIANGVLIWGGRTGGKTMTMTLCALKKMIENAPTEDAVEVVHGRWEDMWDGKYANPRYRCSVCKEKANYKSVQDELLSWHYVQVLTPYCAYCMAKLDGEREDNE